MVQHSLGILNLDGEGSKKPMKLWQVKLHLNKTNKLKAHKFLKNFFPFTKISNQNFIMILHVIIFAKHFGKDSLILNIVI